MTAYRWSRSSAGCPAHCPQGSSPPRTQSSQRLPWCPAARVAHTVGAHAWKSRRSCKHKGRQVALPWAARHSRRSRHAKLAQHQAEHSKPGFRFKGALAQRLSQTVAASGGSTCKGLGMSARAVGRRRHSAASAATQCAIPAGVLCLPLRCPYSRLSNLPLVCVGRAARLAVWGRKAVRLISCDLPQGLCALDRPL